jgi:hypothetical protein
VDGLLPADDRLGVLDALWRAFPPDEPLGDAIGLAVIESITDDHYVTHIDAFLDSQPCAYCHQHGYTDRYVDPAPVR